METFCKQCGQPSQQPWCSACAESVRQCDGLLPEHIVSRVPADRARAWLVDPWGRAHGVADAGSIVGRGPEDVAVYHHSVSRQHARLTGTGTGGGNWRARDLGSKNGTFVAGERIAGTRAIRDGAALTFGKVPFRFRTALGGAVAAEWAAPSTIDVASDGFRCTLRSPDDGRRLILLRVSADVDGPGIALLQHEADRSEHSLAAIELELLRILVDRARTTSDLGSAISQCVSAAELATRLPFRSPHPADDNVRQAVRRLRKTLAALGVAELVEAIPPHGYRLRWTIE